MVAETYVLTYDHPHRKTYDLVTRLLAEGVRPHLLVLPWVERKNHRPLYQVRPLSGGIAPSLMAVRFDLDCGMYSRGDDIVLPEGARVIVGGAGLLPEQFVNDYDVYNAHPGQIPLVRGLDALKWSIYYDNVIGVTLHRLDGECDMGELVEFARLPLMSTDSIYSVGYKLYELEIDLLASVPFREKILIYEYDEAPLPPNRRMPHHKELQMAGRLHHRLMMENEP